MIRITQIYFLFRTEVHISCIIKVSNIIYIIRTQGYIHFPCEFIFVTNKIFETEGIMRKLTIL